MRDAHAILAPCLHLVPRWRCSWIDFLFLCRDGEVGAEELVQAMAHWGVPVTQQEAQYMIDEVSLDANFTD